MPKKALYQQIEDYIQDRIESGEFTVSEQIPTELELGDMFGASKMTVTQALANLVRKGLIYRMPGKGSFVRMRYPEDKTYRLFLNEETFFNNSMKTSYRLAEYTIIKALETDFLESVFNLDNEEKEGYFHRIVRKCYSSGVFLGVEYAFVPVDLVSVVDMRSITFPIAEYMESASGLTCEYNEIILHSAESSPLTSEYITDSEASLLRVRNKAINKKNQVLYYTESFFIGKIYQYSFISYKASPEAKEAGEKNSILYTEIEDYIRNKIDSDEWPVGSKIPTEAELCKTFGVARMTVRRAMENLVNQKMIERITKTGTFVLRKSESKQKEILFKFIELRGAPAKSAKTRLFSYEIVPASKEPEIRSILGLSERDYIYRIIRQCLTGESGIQGIEKIYISAATVPVFDIRATEGDIFENIEKTMNVSVTKRIVKVYAKRTDAQAAELTGIDEGIPALRATSVSFTEEDTPFAVEKVDYLNKHYDFVVTQWE